jgi:2-polyprenyl-6-methoxyphenol hydroxylase-like FAD-dependent oxidoreductase
MYMPYVILCKEHVLEANKDMTSSLKPFSVAAISGGIAGVTLTISLLTRNIDVHLYERDANFEEVGAGIGLGPNAIKAERLRPRYQEVVRQSSNFVWRSGKRDRVV